MLAIGLALCRANLPDAILRRFVLSTLWLVAGRAGEVATTSWKLARWDYTYEYLYLDWSQSKTMKQKGVGIFPDKDCYFIDWYHNFACMLACGYLQDETPDKDDANDDPTAWWLPSWASLADGGAAKKTTTFLSDLTSAGKSQAYR
jgi:hypothetical protein